MSAERFTLEDLKRFLASAAGVDDGAHLSGDILDSRFEELGYESLAVLETGGQIERRYGISLDDAALVKESTLREFIDTVNAQLSAGVG